MAIASVLTVGLVATVWWLLGRPIDAAQPGPATVPASSGPAADQRAGGYAVAIRALAEQVHSSLPLPEIYVLDRTCPDVMSTPPIDADCDTPISAELRRALIAALAPFSKVEFVSSAAAVTGPDLEIVGDGVLTMLGHARFDTGSGEVSLAVRQGGLNGRGMTYVLSYRDGQWATTGSAGSAWIN